MTATLTLAVVLSLAPMSMPGTAQAAGGSCASAATWRVPPDHIDVKRIHHKGSDVPARVERWSFRRYVGAVAASGAWPNRVWANIQVGAIAIHGYALWQVIKTCRSWHGQSYAITDSEMYLRPGMRPWSHIPTRTMRAVRSVWDVTLMKAGHHFRTGWSGGTCNDSWHLCEDSVRASAEAGHGWHWIVRHYLSPNLRIIER